MAVADAASAAIAIRALEPLHQFLEDEHGAGHRRVESGAEARAGPGRNQHAAVWPGSTKYPSDKMSEARPHLDGGPLAPKREARADGQNPPRNFTGIKRNGAGGSFPPKTAST